MIVEICMTLITDEIVNHFLCLFFICTILFLATFLVMILVFKKICRSYYKF